MRDPKSMSLDDLQAFLDKVRDGAARDNALREAFLEVGTAMADILGLLEKQGPELAGAIASALKHLKVQAELQAPEIRVEVNPTPVEVKVAAPTVNVQAPVVTFSPPANPGGWLFEVDPKPGGGFKIQAKRTKA